ncbi:aminotransferase-like domain-containing protein [Paenibacillus caseinilyticus]|uniref:GntR family transcriptional regulator n=1 Tax=Paenibacillus mucilaginosus K02 TaxID=997761 RepID=I0BE37_9BACL|nr:PLP-dependent aminotransferase family protein [Paenibacillus mucilaginosus]AFH60634.1 GntR family transcriptional regulator [Paenibacillus mucilaginosus K02]
MNTKYLQIMDVIRGQMTSGQLRAGNKLPSIRQLSERFSCSKNTIIRALNELEKEHLIYSVPKSGYYVVNESQSSHSDIMNKKIDFLSAGPDKEAMPYLDFQHCLNQAIDMYKDELFNYSDQQGFYSLRLQLVKHLQDLQVFTVPERLFMVSGSQQALNLLVSMPFPNGKDNILLEQPTYFGLIDSVQLHNKTAFGIDRTRDGIDLNRLEFIFRNNQIKFFYTVPRFHNPLGYSYTNEQKKRIVELAQKYDVYIVEDDYLGSLDPNPKSDPMFAYDPSGRVIYMKSFSKIMLPGLRLGVAVLPHLMVSTFLRYKFSADFNSSALSQGALEIYLKNGMFSAHIKKIRERYQRKMQLLQEACEQYLPPDTFYSKPTSGFYLTVFLPERIKAKQVVNSLLKENIFVDDSTRMFLPEYRKENMLRLSVSQVEENLITQGVEQIARFIQLIQENSKKEQLPLWQAALWL